MENISFEKLWGLVQIHLKENGKRSLYSEAIEVKRGEISPTSVVIYVKNDGNLLDRPESKKIVEDIIYLETLKNMHLVVKIDRSAQEKISKLKKMFGSILEIE